MNICWKCQHHKFKSEKSATWYNNFCTATTNKITIDPVTGNEVYNNGNSSSKHPYCSAINPDGNCELYVKISCLTEPQEEAK